MTSRSLYPFQSTAIRFLQKSNIHLALTAPTGSGKGVVLEVLAENPEERILLLTPLIALARQQRIRFELAGIPAHRVRILSPESALLQERRIQEWDPTLVAVDEAHCIYEWGERFRPAYGQLFGLLQRLRVSRSLWMSATFPRTLFQDLLNNVDGSWTRLGTFSFPKNLDSNFLQTRPTDRVEIIRESVLHESDPGILFVGTRKEVRRYFSVLGPMRPMLPYHAGLSDEERRAVENRLLLDKCARYSIVATNAFGMGMDFPSLRWVKLAQAPYSLLALTQAFGRVARAGKSGVASVYWTEEDFRFAGLLLGNAPKRAHEELAGLRQYLEGTDASRREFERGFFL